MSGWKPMARAPWGRKEFDDDPDETAGRKLYRGRANALAKAQVSLARRRVCLLGADEARKAFE